MLESLKAIFRSRNKPATPVRELSRYEDLVWGEIRLGRSAEAVSLASAIFEDTFLPFRGELLCRMMRESQRQGLPELEVFLKARLDAALSFHEANGGFYFKDYLFSAKYSSNDAGSMLGYLCESPSGNADPVVRILKLSKGGWSGDKTNVIVGDEKGTNYLNKRFPSRFEELAHDLALKSGNREILAVVSSDAATAVPRAVGEGPKPIP